jgi:RNA polymerase sigma factor (sigma-70 family)
MRFRSKKKDSIWHNIPVALLGMFVFRVFVDMIGFPVEVARTHPENIGILLPTTNSFLPFMKDKNFDLSSEEFELLVNHLRGGDLGLFKQIFLRHFSECTWYLQRNYSSSPEDAYDASMDTMLDFRQRLVDGKITYGNLRYLFTRMASQVYLRKYRKVKADMEVDHEILLLEEPLDMTEDDFKILDKAWSQLSKECQDLMRLNYYQGLKLSEIAEKWTKPATAIRKQKERCKQHLIQLYNILDKQYQDE